MSGAPAVRHRRLGRRRQVDADRPPALRLEGDLRGPARGRRAHQSRAMGVRVHEPRAAHRRPAGRAGAGHHDRRRLPLLRHAQAEVHHRRHPRPHPVHAQHGHRRVDRRPRARSSSTPARACSSSRRRHAFLASLLRIPHLVLCVNKMDLVDWTEERFEEIKAEFRAFAMKLDITDLTFIPVSALHGDNVVDRSANMPWYEGSSLLHHLEEVHIALGPQPDRRPLPGAVRDPAARPTDYHDYRGYAGTVAGGVLKPGDEVVVLPSGFTSTIAAIDTADGPVDEALPADVGDHAPRRRDRHQPRRHDLPAATTSRTSARTSTRWCAGCHERTAAARGAKLRHQAHHPLRPGRW